MIKQSLVLLPVLLWMMGTLAVSKGQIRSDKNCTRQCGNLTIPFPFGLGSTRCYLDDWFEIVCHNSTAYLNLTELEVTKISVADSTLLVRHPIAFSSPVGVKDEKEYSNESKDLEGTPFVFSQGNRYTAVGCGVLALMETRLATLGGCLSYCEPQNSKKDKNIKTTTAASNISSCNGFHCCQTTIVSNLTSFNTTFLFAKERDLGERECTYAFLVHQEWFVSSMRDTISSIKKSDMVDVPVELEWGILRTPLPTTDFDEYWSINSSCTKFPAADSTSSCNNSSALNHSRIQCKCPPGYEGNPYLVRGCTGINISKVYALLIISKFLKSFSSDLGFHSDHDSPAARWLPAAVWGFELLTLEGWFPHMGA